MHIPYLLQKCYHTLKITIIINLQQGNKLDNKKDNLRMSGHTFLQKHMCLYALCVFISFFLLFIELLCASFVALISRDLTKEDIYSIPI